MLEMLLHSPEEVSSGNDYVLKQTAANQTTNWIVPNGVTSICCVCVGHGAISGGGLSWRNNIPVTPGEVLTLSFTTPSTSTPGNTNLRVKGTIVCISYTGLWVSQAFLGAVGGLGGKTANAINDGGGNGGTGYRYSNYGVAGGGAGGYLGNGGVGTNSNSGNTAGVAGSGSGSGAKNINSTSIYSGGNVGLYGIGITGGNVIAGVSSNGNDGSISEVMCGGGIGSITSNFNGGIRIIWGEGYSYPLYAITPYIDPNIVPVMTDNTAPTGYIATVSSTFNDGLPPFVS